MNLESKRRKLKRGIEIVQGQNLFCQGTVCDEICYVDVSPSYEQYLFFQQYRNINISGTYLPKSRFFTCVIQIIQGQYVFNQCTVCDKICYVCVNPSCEQNFCSSRSIEMLQLRASSDNGCQIWPNSRNIGNFFSRSFSRTFRRSMKNILLKS